MNDQDIELIEHYLDGMLPPKERQQFEERITHDSDLKAALQWHLDLRQVSIAEEELRLIQMLKNTKPQSSKIYRLSYKVYALAATLLFLILAGTWWWASSPPKSLFAAYFQPYPNVSVPLERNEPLDNLKIRAFYSYEQGAYQLAAAQLDSLLQIEANSDYRFYLAMAQLSNNEYLSAIDNLQIVQQAANTNMQEHSTWYLALAYWKVGKTTQAKDLIKRVAANKKHPFALKAQGVLKEYGLE